MQIDCGALIPECFPVQYAMIIVLGSGDTFYAQSRNDALCNFACVQNIFLSRTLKTPTVNYHHEYVSMPEMFIRHGAPRFCDATAKASIGSIVSRLRR